MILTFKIPQYPSFSKRMAVSECVQKAMNVHVSRKNIAVSYHLRQMMINHTLSSFQYSVGRILQRVLAAAVTCGTL